MKMNPTDHGFQVTDEAGEIIGHIDYSDVDEATISIDHTIVSPSHQGQGIASALVEAVVNRARAEGKLIRPICSYAYAQFRRHPEYCDVLDHSDSL